MRTFIVHDHALVYKVAMRGHFQDTITSEAELRAVVTKSFDTYYGKDQSVGRDLWDMCSILGCIGAKWRVEKSPLGGWREVR
jgi:hypothetical protein